MTSKIEEISGITWDSVPEKILTSTTPLLLRGLVASWPIVQQAKISNGAVINYLKKFCIDKPVVVYSAPPEARGRFFYGENGIDLNFTSSRAPLREVLQQLDQLQNVERPPSLYVGSTTVDVFLPGLRDENDVITNTSAPLVSLWLGNETTVAAHFDAPDNIACCVAGSRTFTVFPPDQIENLYIGPLDRTPSGQPISMVDFEQPDFSVFPKYKIALEHAQVAELEPGDALFLPRMWWHHVRSKCNVNVLINYWMRDVPKHIGPGLDALKLAILNIRDLPAEEKKAWRSIFEYYIFSDQSNKFQHINPLARGCLAPLDESSARQIRAWLLNRLNR